MVRGGLQGAKGLAFEMEGRTNPPEEGDEDHRKEKREGHKITV